MQVASVVAPHDVDLSSKRAFCSPLRTFRSCTTALHNMAKRLQWRKHNVQISTPYSRAADDRNNKVEIVSIVCRMLQEAVCILGHGPGRELGCHENVQIPGGGLWECYGNGGTMVDGRAESQTRTLG